MQELTNDTFDSTIEKGITVVDFWAPWCGPCRQFAPVFEEAANEAKEATFAKVNIDEQGDIAQRFGVMSIPTVVFFKDGKPVEQFSGARGKDEVLQIVQGLQ